jgi:MYXO-CTERM domain-containing protein
MWSERWRARTWGVLQTLLLLSALAPLKPALANGAFPDEFSIHFPPGAPDRILVGSNFGLLVSEDNGATWRYACEPYVTSGSSAALSPDLVSFYQVTADDAVLADSTNVTRSPDDGCTWPTSGGSITGQVVTDVFPDPNDATLVLAITASIHGTMIVASHDGAVTFGASIYSTPDVLTGIEFARSTPGVIYATKVSADGNTSILLRSTDSGSTWTSMVIPVAAGTQPRILAVDPEDSNTVYVRLLTGSTDSIGITTDGGTTFDVPLTIRGIFDSFLRASDGTLYAGTFVGDLYVRSPGSLTFTHRTAPHLRCLGQRPGTTRIYACADMNVDGFSIGSSDDGAQTFQKVMKFTDLLGPLTCNTVATACAAHWARIQTVLNISDAGVPDAGVPSVAKSGSCTSAPGEPEAALLLAGLVLLAMFRRRVGAQ